MVATEMSPDAVEELYALWEMLRTEAISERDRQEIDEVFARQLP